MSDGAGSPYDKEVSPADLALLREILSGPRPGTRRRRIYSSQMDPMYGDDLSGNPNEIDFGGKAEFTPAPRTPPLQARATPAQDEYLTAIMRMIEGRSR